MPLDEGLHQMPGWAAATLFLPPDVSISEALAPRRFYHWLILWAAFEPWRITWHHTTGEG